MRKVEDAQEGDVHAGGFVPVEALVDFLVVPEVEGRELFASFPVSDW